MERHGGGGGFQNTGLTGFEYLLWLKRRRKGWTGPKPPQGVVYCKPIPKF
jgi:hypothetical protein